MIDDEYFFGNEYQRAPRSVFYRGIKKARHLNSFNKTHVTQAKLEFQRYRTQRPRRVISDDDDDDVK